MFISQKVKDVLLKNVQHINFDIKTKILTDFQICINVPLILSVFTTVVSLLKSELKDNKS